MSKIKRIGYIVNRKHICDNNIALEFALLFPLATSKHEAWRDFLSISGKDRQYWNKLGYIAEKVQYTLEFVK